jgi:hypothetical protein
LFPRFFRLALSITVLVVELLYYISNQWNMFPFIHINRFLIYIHVGIYTCMYIYIYAYLHTHIHIFADWR